MTFLQLKTRIRKRTQHVNDVVRLTETSLNDIVNRKYRELRTELQDLAPSLNVETGPALTVAAGDTLSTGGAERVIRLERQINDVWRPVDKADAVEPEQHMFAEVAWEERGGCIYLHPEGQVTSAEYGQFRVLYYPLTTELTDDAHIFVLPTTLEDVLFYRCCAEVTDEDGDDPKAFEERADKALERVAPALAARYGVHTSDTFREVLGY